MILTDEELNKAFDDTFEKGMDFDHKPSPEEIFTLQLRSVALAQEAKTLATQSDTERR